MVFESRTPSATVRSGFAAKPQTRRPVSVKHNNPQDKPVVIKSRTPCAAVRSGFAAKTPQGRRPGIRKAQQSTGQACGIRIPHALCCGSFRLCG